MSNLYNRVFGVNNNDSDSDEENIQEESSIISASQPGRQLEESDIFNQQYLEERRRRRRHLTQQPQIIEPTNQFNIPPINNKDETNVETNFEQTLATQLQGLNTNQTIITDNL